MAICDETTGKDEFLKALQHDLCTKYMEADNVKLLTIIQKSCEKKEKKTFMEILDEISPIPLNTSRSVIIMRTKYENLKNRPRKIDHLLLTVRRA